MDGMGSKKLLNELRRLAAADTAEDGVLSIHTDGFSMDEQEAACLIMKIHEKYKGFPPRNETETPEPAFCGRVLIVDDIETNLYMLDLALQPYGFQTENALSGIEAIEMIKSGKIYDIIFMDHMMPVMDGIKTVGKIREYGYAHPIIACTAQEFSERGELFLHNGFDGFISKPVDEYKLHAILRRFIWDRQSREPAEKENRHSAVDPQLMQHFIYDAQKIIPEIEKILKSENPMDDEIQLFTVYVHGLKSSLALIGENGLSAAALSLEKAGNEKNIRIITSEAPGFLEKLHALVDGISGMDDGMHFLCGQLFEFQTACVIKDKHAAISLLDELELKKWPPHLAEQLEKISRYIRCGEFDIALETAEKTISMAL